MISLWVSLDGLPLDLRIDVSPHLLFTSEGKMLRPFPVHPQ